MVDADLIDFDDVALIQDDLISIDNVSSTNGEDPAEHHEQSQVVQQGLASDQLQPAVSESDGTPPLPPVTAVRPPRLTGTPDLPPPEVSHGRADGDLNANRRYNGRAALIVGFIQIFVGISCIVLGATAIVFGVRYADVTHGIWAGLTCVSCGIVGIVSYKAKIRFLITLYLVISILSVSCAVAAFILSIFACADTDKKLCISPCNNLQTMNISLAFNLVTSIVSMIDLTLCVISIFITCRAVCSQNCCSCCWMCWEVNNHLGMNSLAFGDQSILFQQFGGSHNELVAGFEGNIEFRERPPPYMPREPPPSYTPTPRNNQDK